MAETCSKCKRDMEFLKEQIVSDTKYRIYKCSKCNKQVAKSE
jgi:DNA-directed RNA polymerase subunit RPC12/RpoP|tara:strand:+ start:810 stop:935 length:126 start_codon:yes stop_codon:yes gene_type:complete